MRTVDYPCPVEEYGPGEELPPGVRALIEAAAGVVTTAHAPYSGFHVGAAVLLSNGQVITGTNQENVAYPSGMCAERVALYHAFSQWPGAHPVGLALTAWHRGGPVPEPVTPCGACRQALAEYLKRSPNPVWVAMHSSQRILLVRDARTLLPLNFTF